MDRCFCHLNGYKVKDADARKSIEDLQNNKVEVSALEEITTQIEAEVTALDTKVESVNKRFDYLPIPKDASEISFSNTGTGLNSTNVQTAIVEFVNGTNVALEEMEERVSSVQQGTAQGTTFNNTVSGLSATNVQSAIDELAGVTIIGTLVAGATEITLSNVAITENSTVDIYTNVYGVVPSNVVVTTGNIALTFDTMESDLNVKVKVI